MVATLNLSQLIKLGFARRVAGALAAVTVVALLLSGCGGSRASSSTGSRLPADYVPIAVGPGRLYRPGLASARVRSGRPVDGLRCRRRAGRRFGAHLEVFAHQREVAIAAGIGLAPPLARLRAAVIRARCYYAAVTTDPTGVIQLRARSPITLGVLFDLWGQPLGRREVAGFKATGGSAVIAFVDGRRWRSDPRQIRLLRHARITLEIASHVLPHRVYLFPPGL
jgi:hypothetical protein